MSRRARIYAGLAAAAGAALLVGLLLSGGAAVTAAGSGGAPKVGEVTSVSGSGDIRVDAAKGATQLREGDDLHLGDVIVPGKGVNATLELEVPKGVSDDTDLVFVRPPEGMEHIVRMERITKRTTEVKIED